MDIADSLRIERITDLFPVDFSSLREEALTEGYAFVERLVAEWHAGITRFDQPEELLVAAFVTDELAAIGGLTRDPQIPEALRMRRFYVRPHARGFGVGRALQRVLLSTLDADRMVTVHAGTLEARSFWTSVGFIPDTHPDITHIRRPW